MSQIRGWSDNLKVLNPKMKIIDNNYDLKSIVGNVKSFQNYLNSIETKNFSEYIGIYKSNINDLLINLKRIKENIDDFYSISGVKINNLKSIDRILDEAMILENPNLCKLEDDLDPLINKIYQYKTNVGDLNTDIFDLDLEKMLSDVNDIYAKLNNLSISVNLLCSEDIDKIQNQFGQINDNLMLSPFKNYIDDKDRKYQLKTVYQYKENISEEMFYKIFKEIRKIYLYDVDNNEILLDIGQFIKNIKELDNLKKELINSYSDSKNDLSFKELDIIFKYENKLNDIRNKIFEYDNFNISSIEDLQYTLAKLIIFKELYDYIISNDDVGNKYFGKYWKSYKSNLNDLITQRNNLIKFNELINAGLINSNTPDNLPSFDNSSFLTFSDNIRKLKRNIIGDIKNINNNFNLDLKTVFSSDVDELFSNINVILEDLIVLEKWESFKEFNTNLNCLNMI